MKEETRMMCENKSAAHAVNGSTGGGLGYAQERQKISDANSRLILLLYRQLDAEQKADFLEMVAAMVKGGPSRRRCGI